MFQEYKISTALRRKLQAVLLSIVMLFVVSKLATVGIPPTWAQTAEQAKQADRLVDSIGVNTHFGYHNVYSSDYQGLKSKLGKLAVRHIRDGVNSINGPRIRELYKLYGIRLTAIAGRRVDGSYDKPLDLNAIDDELTDIKKYALAATEAIEGPNEYDISHGSDSDWVSRIRRYQRLLYSKVKSDTLLKNRPILGPSLTSEEAYKKVGDLTSIINYTNAHPYAGGRNPGTKGWGDNGYGSLPWVFQYNTRRQSASKPPQFTECGYHNAVNSDSGHVGTSETAVGKYMSRMFAEYFRHGVARAFLYELVDEGTDPNHLEDRFGLLRNDLTEKPAYRSLRNTIDLLKDPGSSFKPGSLTYSLSGDLRDIHRLLLQKRDGSFYLVIWQEVPSFDVDSKKDLSPTARSLTLKLGTKISTAETYLPLNSTSKLNRYTSPRSIPLKVPDHLLIVKLVPATVGALPIPEPTLAAQEPQATAYEHTGFHTSSPSFFTIINRVVFFVFR